MSKSTSSTITLLRSRSTRTSSKNSLKPGDTYITPKALNEGQTVAGNTPISVNAPRYQVGKKGTYSVKVGSRTVVPFSAIPSEVIVLAQSPDSTSTFRVIRRTGTVDRPEVKPHGRD